jgi:hypothetical protein
MKQIKSLSKKYVFLLLVFFPVFVFAQSASDTAKVNTPPPPADIAGLENRRAISQMFYNEIQILSTPSTVSGTIVSNWEFYEGGNYYKSPFILNGDVQLPIALGGRGWYSNRSGFLHTLHVIPQFKVRILDEDAVRGDSSLPVRTPSYMPRLSYYGTQRHLINDKHIFYYGLSAFHHSNGQDGNEFIDSVHAGANSHVGDVNRYNGNFGENCVFEVMLGGMWKRDTVRPEQVDNTPPNAPEYLHMRWRSSKQMQDRYVKLSFEFHPKALTNRDLMKYNMYSRYRINLQTGLIISRNSVTELWSPTEKKWFKEGKEFPKELFRIILDANFLLGSLNTGNLSSLAPAPISRRINIWVTGHVRIPGTKMASGFVQVGYWGSDNYNIYFSQRLIMVQWGLSFGYYRYGNTKETLSLFENNK